MKLEDLTAKGLTEEQAKLVMTLHKQSIDGNYVPKATFDAEREKVKTLNDTVAQRDAQITELGKFKGNAEELQKKVDTLTADNAKVKADYEAKLKDAEELSIIRTAIGDKVHSIDDILPRLDRAKIVYANGKIVAGLDDQIESIQKASPHYFKEQNKPSGVPGGWNPWGNSPRDGAGVGDNDSAAEFGKSLAKAQAQGIASTNKAADMYFK